jgi:hypothetical protein
MCSCEYWVEVRASYRFERHAYGSCLVRIFEDLGSDLAMSDLS